MAAYNIYEAKTNFSSLVEKAMDGEEVLIAKAGKPLLKLVPLREIAQTGGSRVYRTGGQNFAGWGAIPATVDDPLPEEMQHALGMHE